jgi:hypothetical protein
MHTYIHTDIYICIYIYIYNMKEKLFVKDLEEVDMLSRCSLA